MREQQLQIFIPSASPSERLARSVSSADLGQPQGVRFSGPLRFVTAAFVDPWVVVTVTIPLPSGTSRCFLQTTLND